MVSKFLLLVVTVDERWERADFLPVSCCKNFGNQNGKNLTPKSETNSIFLALKIWGSALKDEIRLYLMFKCFLTHR